MFMIVPLTLRPKQYTPPGTTPGRGTPLTQLLHKPRSAWILRLGRNHLPDKRELTVGSVRLRKGPHPASGAAGSGPSSNSEVRLRIVARAADAAVVSHPGERPAGEVRVRPAAPSGLSRASAFASAGPVLS